MVYHAARLRVLYTFIPLLCPKQGFKALCLVEVPMVSYITIGNIHPPKVYANYAKMFA